MAKNKKVVDEDAIEDVPEVTLWEDPISFVETIDGLVLYMDWIKKERDRINAGARDKVRIFGELVQPVYVVTDEDYRVCLSHDKEYKPRKGKR